LNPEGLRVEVANKKTLQYLKEEKTTEREKRLTDKEFKEICKKAKVDPGSLAKTVFTESLESS